MARRLEKKSGHEGIAKKRGKDNRSGPGKGRRRQPTGMTISPGEGDEYEDKEEEREKSGIRDLDGVDRGEVVGQKENRGREQQG